MPGEAHRGDISATCPRERALVAGGRATVAIERGAGDATVIAATDQARAALLELHHHDHDHDQRGDDHDRGDDRGDGRADERGVDGAPGLLAEVLGRLLEEVDRCRREQAAGSPRLEALLRWLRIAWFTHAPTGR